jgi:tetratricopeptide (TPR) repeat protein
MARLLLALLLLLPLATPVRAADSTMETQLRYLEKDLDRLREEVKALPEARRLERLEAEIAGLRAEIKAAEKSAEEAVKEKLEAQDKRIGDLSLTLSLQANQLSGSANSVTWMSILITVALFFVAGITAINVPRQAKSEARAAIMEHMRSAEGQGQVVEAVKVVLNEDENAFIESQAQRGDTAKPDAASSKVLPPPGAEHAIEKILDMPPLARTANQWRALIQNLIEQKSFDAALALSEFWLTQPNQTSIDTAFALRTKGLVLLRAGRHAEAIIIHDELLRRFDEDTTNPKIREHLAIALLNKGISLTLLAPPQYEAGIDAFNQVIRRFRHDTSPMQREQVAWALYNKGYALGLLAEPQRRKEISVYNCLIKHFGNDPALDEIVSWALYNKGVAFGKLEPAKHQAAIDTYKTVCARFGADTRMREQVAKALVNIGVALGSLDPPQYDARISTYNDVVHRFSNDRDPAIREQVAIALSNKGGTLAHLNRLTEARATYEEYIRRFADSDAPGIKEITKIVHARLAKLPPS